MLTKVPIVNAKGQHLSIYLDLSLAFEVGPTLGENGAPILGMCNIGMATKSDIRAYTVRMTQEEAALLVNKTSTSSLLA